MVRFFAPQIGGDPQSAALGHNSASQSTQGQSAEAERLTGASQDAAVDGEGKPAKESNELVMKIPCISCSQFVDGADDAFEMVLCADCDAEEGRLAEQFEKELDASADDLAGLPTAAIIDLQQRMEDAFENEDDMTEEEMNCVLGISHACNRQLERRKKAHEN